MIQLVECPRDAMQGLKTFIPTDVKVNYINQLLKVGFHTLDFGSFVSPKAIPQMRDTVEVLDKLDLSKTKTRLLAIVANERGAAEAATHKPIQYLGYPFSVSETFQIRNTNATIAESLSRVKAIQEICVKNNKQLVLYVSMGFGNPYGDPWNADVVLKWVDELSKEGIQIFSLSDTIGVSNPTTIAYLFSHLIKAYPNLEFGAHLHTEPHNWREKIQAAYAHGCLRFDVAMRGFGGCPMAKDDLTGNMATENVVHFFKEMEQTTGQSLLKLNQKAFLKGFELSNSVFYQPH
jgi:hydroxymethylglutaryl-CoA lyase